MTKPKYKFSSIKPWACIDYKSLKNYPPEDIIWSNEKPTEFHGNCEWTELSEKEYESLFKKDFSVLLLIPNILIVCLTIMSVYLLIILGYIITKSIA